MEIIVCHISDITSQRESFMIVRLLRLSFWLLAIPAKVLPGMIRWLQRCHVVVLYLRVATMRSLHGRIRRSDRSRYSLTRSHQISCMGGVVSTYTAITPKVTSRRRKDASSSLVPSENVLTPATSEVGSTVTSSLSDRVRDESWGSGFA